MEKGLSPMSLWKRSFAASRDCNLAEILKDRRGHSASATKLRMEPAKGKIGMQEESDKETMGSGHRGDRAADRGKFS